MPLFDVDGEEDDALLYPDKKIDALRRFPLFKPLDYLDLVKILNILKVEHYKEGDRIIREGEESDKLYIVLTGGVEVRKSGKQLAEFSPGFFFGEMGLIDESPRSADVLALESTRLLVVPHADFRNMLNQESRMALKVLWAFCEVLNSRLRLTSQEVADLCVEKPDFPTAMS